MKLMEKYHGPVSPSRAYGCFAANQFLTPGLGSLLGRRFRAALGQLTVFLAGFVLFVVWFLDIARQYYAMMERDITPELHHWLGFVGIGLCAAGWLWALVTSISLIREARRNEREGKLAVAG